MVQLLHYILVMETQPGVTKMKSLDDIQYECAKEELCVTREWLVKVTAAADAEIIKGINDGKAAVLKLAGDHKTRAEKIVRALQIVAADRGLAL
jgi:hypothetical protein